MDTGFLQNPIVLAILAAALSYLYLYLEHKKKQEENPKAKIEPISYTIPLVVGFCTFFIAYNFFGSPKPTQVAQELISQVAPKLTHGGFSDNKATTDSFGSNTYRLVGKNTIKLPQTDVFIDMAHF